MSKLAKFKVTRAHLGDDVVTADDGAVSMLARNFAVGDIRVADPLDVRHLTDSGILVEIQGKAAAPLRNKADSVPSNKRRPAAPKKKA